MSKFLSAPDLRFLGTRDTVAGNPTASLQNVNTTNLKSGAQVFVDEVKAYYMYSADSTETPDGVTVIAPGNGPGRWFRALSTDPLWALEADWYVDAVNGSDGNAGTTASAPLQTLLELERRIGTAIMMQTTTVHLLSDIPETDRFQFRGSYGADSIYIQILGEASTTLATVTVAVYTDLVLGVTRPSVQISGFDWTPYLGKRVRVTASAGATPIGTVFWVEQVDANPEIAYISQPYAADFVTFVPFGPQVLLAGDTLVVEDLTICGGIAFDTKSSNVNTVINLGLVLKHVRFTAGTFTNLLAENMVTFGCELNMHLARGFFDIYASKVGSTGFTQIWQTNISQSYLHACSIQNNLLIQGPAPFIVIENTSMQGCHIVIEATNIFRVSNQGNTGFSAWDWPGFALDFDELSNGYLEGLFWGTSTVANSQAIRIRSLSTVMYLNANKPTANGAWAASLSPTPRCPLSRLPTTRRLSCVHRNPAKFGYERIIARGLALKNLTVLK